MSGQLVPAEYGQLLEAVKQEITAARVRAARAVNSDWWCCIGGSGD